MSIIGINIDIQTKQAALQAATAGAAAAAAGGLNPIADIAALMAEIKLISELFKDKPNPNDWVGWDAMDSSLNQWKGSAVRGWVLNDGDSVENEALNIVSYIKSKGLEILINTGHPVTIMGQGWRDVTIDEIVNKLSRGGYSSEAAAIKSAYYAKPIYNILNSTTATITPNITAGMNIWVTVALAGAAIFAISKIKK